MIAAMRKEPKPSPTESPMIGHELPLPSAALRLLYAFHDDEKIEEAKQRRLPDQIAYIPEETPPLEGLGQVSRDLAHYFHERSPEQLVAMMDRDTTIIGSRKREA
jgi:hypothetical protein